MIFMLAKEKVNYLFQMHPRLIKSTIFLIIWFVYFNIDLTLAFKFSLTHHLQPISHKNNLSWKIERHNDGSQMDWNNLKINSLNWSNWIVHENNFYGYMLKCKFNHYKKFWENWTFIWRNNYFSRIYLNHNNLDVILLILAYKTILVLFPFDLEW